jgi:hypothetical protein
MNSFYNNERSSAHEERMIREWQALLVMNERQKKGGNENHEFTARTLSSRKKAHFGELPSLALVQAVEEISMSP